MGMFCRLVFPALIKASFTSSIYEANKAMAVRAAEPMANPLPMAAVVLPTASSMSVLFRTPSGNFAISALPPALSAIAPKASVANTKPRLANMPTAAREIPASPKLTLLKLNPEAQ